MPRLCERCGESFMGRKEKRFCSVPCRNASFKIDPDERRKRLLERKRLRCRAERQQERRLAAEKLGKPYMTEEECASYRLAHNEDIAALFDAGDIESRKVRRLRERAQSDGTITARYRRLVLSISVCHWCNQITPSHLRTLDHFIPLAKGGRHSSTNAVMACFHCNSRKGDIFPDAFMRIKFKPDMATIPMEAKPKHEAMRFAHNSRVRIKSGYRPVFAGNGRLEYITR